MFPRHVLDRMHGRLQKVADDFGVPFKTSPHAPNTKRALALSAWAAEQGQLDAWRAHAMDAYWKDGRDLEDDGVLRELLTASGLDATAGLAFLDDPSVPDLLRAQREDAHRWGVTGIPTWFMLPDGWSPGDPRPETGPKPVMVVGCQPMEMVERAAVMAGADPVAA